MSRADNVEDVKVPDQSNITTSATPRPRDTSEHSYEKCLESPAKRQRIGDTTITTTSINFTIDLAPDTTEEQKRDQIIDYYTSQLDGLYYRDYSSSYITSVTNGNMRRAAISGVTNVSIGEREYAYIVKLKQDLDDHFDIFDDFRQKHRSGIRFLQTVDKLKRNNILVFIGLYVTQL